MVFNANIPQPNDDLSDSQPVLLTNNQSINTSFGIDHYSFSDLTVNNGKHNQMTTPLIVGGVHPTTAAAEPKMYAMQDSANLGVINYSRGPSNAVPTPITNLQSTAAAIVLAPSATTNVLDFTGLSRAICTLYAFDGVVANAFLSSTFYWTGVLFKAIPTSGVAVFFQFVASGNILQIKNVSVGAMNNVYWTLSLQRTS